MPDTGTVHWDDTDLTRTPANERGFGLMFQDHALFTHRDVAENVAFGLKMQHVDRAARAERVRCLLDLVGLSGYERRSIDTLSGGEAQRVALARALAPSPRLLMLDEPLGSLDRALRDRLAVDLRRVLRELHQAAIHVTHDQEEAFTIADRLVVMRAGRIVRDGRATDVWRDPRDEFVARFLGHENILDADVALALGLGDGTASVVVHGDAITLTRDTGFAATVHDVRFRGATSRVALRLVTYAGDAIELVVHTSRPPSVGASVRVCIDPALVAPLGQPANGASASASSDTTPGATGASR